MGEIPMTEAQAPRKSQKPQANQRRGNQLRLGAFNFELLTLPF
jgi:hypothetical protein